MATERYHKSSPKKQGRKRIAEYPAETGDHTIEIIFSEEKHDPNFTMFSVFAGFDLSAERPSFVQRY